MAFVVFLRGVNVGGHRRFRPAELARELEALDVVNVGAAGTFVVRSPASRARIRAEFTSRLPFDTEMMICSDREIVSLMTVGPLAEPPPPGDIVRFVSVLSQRPRLTPSLPLALPVRGHWLLKILAVENRFVCGLYRRHMKAIGYLGTLDRLFGVPATTRSARTIAAVAALLPAARKRHSNDLQPTLPPATSASVKRLSTRRPRPR